MRRFIVSIAIIATMMSMGAVAGASSLIENGSFDEGLDYWTAKGPMHGGGISLLTVDGANPENSNFEGNYAYISSQGKSSLFQTLTLSPDITQLFISFDYEFAYHDPVDSEHGCKNNPETPCQGYKHDWVKVALGLGEEHDHDDGGCGEDESSHEEGGCDCSDNSSTSDDGSHSGGCSGGSGQGGSGQGGSGQNGGCGGDHSDDEEDSIVLLDLKNTGAGATQPPYEFGHYEAVVDVASLIGDAVEPTLLKLEFMLKEACGKFGHRSSFAIDNVIVEAVPEPTTWLLLSCGLLGLLGLQKRRSKK